MDRSRRFAREVARMMSGIRRFLEAVASRMSGVRLLQAVAVILVIWAAMPVAASACEVCWGARVDTPVTRGISMAMLALIGMTGLVGSGIGAFFYNMKRRAEMLEPGDLEVTEFGNIQGREAQDDSLTF